MKNLIKLLFVLSTLLLASCDAVQPTDDDGNAMANILNPNFSLVCTHPHTYFLRDVDTEIIYVLYDWTHVAALSAYYNSEGEPMTYTEFKEVHMAKYHAGE